MKVLTGPEALLAIKATRVEESMPPDSRTPSGTSAISRFSTAWSSSVRMRGTATSSAASGASDLRASDSSDGRASQ